LNDYADGKIEIGSKIIKTDNGFTENFEKQILKAEKESESEVFTNASDAIKFLRKS